MAKQLEIGFYGYTLLEQTPRVLGGILEYRKRRRRFNLRDYSISDLRTVEDGADPPWAGEVDGVLVAAAFEDDTDSALRWVGRGGAPAVSVVSNMIDPRLPVVMLDPDSVASLGVGELARFGCRRLLYVGFAPSDGSALRAEAVKRRAARVGLPIECLSFETMAIECVTESDEENATLAARLLDGPRPVGAVAVNDFMARRVIRVCEQAELTVPDDVAMVGCDDTPTAFNRRPTITSVCYPGEQIGYQAVESLIGLIEGKPAPTRPAMVPAEQLRVRESSGGPPEEDDISRALELIQRMAPFGLRVDQLMESLPVSERTLQREFRRRLGRTPYAEIQRLRIAEARRLLAETEFSVSRIAEMLGYRETAAMSNAFHRATGFWPRDFRRTNRTAK
jgi:LacI family transcriptional regulator